MKFSVAGLPHYTVWHLYEPSVDDIRHMEELEQERQVREDEEKERAERMKKAKEDFKDPNSQWEKDKADIQAIVLKEEEAQKAKEAEAKLAEEAAKRANEQKKDMVGKGGEEGPNVQGKKNEAMPET